MKHLTLIILGAIYLLSTTGATVHHHYCMGELVASSLFHTGDGACGKCGMEKHTEESKDCCKDSSVSTQTADEHIFSSPTYDYYVPQLLIVPDNYVSFTVEIKKFAPATVNHSHSPPLSGQSLFIQFRNLRI